MEVQIFPRFRFVYVLLSVVSKKIRFQNKGLEIFESLNFIQSFSWLYSFSIGDSFTIFNNLVRCKVGILFMIQDLSRLQFCIKKEKKSTQRKIENVAYITLNYRLGRAFFGQFLKKVSHLHFFWQISKSDVHIFNGIKTFLKSIFESLHPYIFTSYLLKILK